MKILLCTDRYYPAISGVVTSVMTLRKYLEAAGHETRILTLSDTVSSHVCNDIVYIGSFDAEKIYPDVRIKHPVNKANLDSLIKWHPDIIHCHTEFSTFFLAKHIYRACRCPMVLTYHTDYEDYVHYVALSRKFGRNRFRSLDNPQVKDFCLNYQIIIISQRILDAVNIFVRKPRHNAVDQRGIYSASRFKPSEKLIP